MKRCTECEEEMMARRAWRRLPLEERAQLREQRISFHQCNGLCGRCYARQWHRAHPKPSRGHLRSAGARERLASIAEDWELLADRSRSQAANIRDLAPRMGMTVTALEKAVLRAKREGLIGRAA